MARSLASLGLLGDAQGDGGEAAHELEQLLQGVDPGDIADSRMMPDDVADFMREVFGNDGCVVLQQREHIVGGEPGPSPIPNIEVGGRASRGGNDQLTF